MKNREGMDLEKIIHEALKENGFGIPSTPEQVHRFETENDFPPVSELPTWMQDPLEALRRRGKITLKLRPFEKEFNDNWESVQLAQAARFGKQIPEAIMEKMQKDRDAQEERAEKIEADVRDTHDE